MNCNNCTKRMEGIAYSYKDNVFCGKSCLVKHLRDKKVIKMELVK